MRLPYTLSRLDRANLTLALLIIVIANAILLNNYFGAQFPVANYFPRYALENFVLLLLMSCGCYLSLGQKNKLTQAMFHLCMFFIVLSLIALLTIAIQVTPFPTIDPLLLKLDTLLGYDTAKVLYFLSRHSLINQILTLAYAFEVLELVLVPSILALLQQFASLHRLYFMLLSSCLVGFVFYYFWPTMGPASIINSPYFTQSQRYTGMKFSQVHHYMTINPLEGGLIAMPSFHIIWAILCQQATANIRILWWLLLPINIILVISCVVLGWHYLVDFLGSVLLLLICYLACRLCRPKLCLSDAAKSP